MEGFIWSLRTLDVFLVVVPVFFLHVFLSFAFERPDYLALLGSWFFKGAFGSDEFKTAAPGVLPSGLVIIPSLLRDGDDFKAITTTIESCATNEFPSDLFIVASVDGRKEFPKLYASLEAWIASREYPANVRVYLTGTETRLGKMMAVEAGVTHVKALVAKGELAAVPTIYFSIDGDGTLGPHALERLAARLDRRHWLTKNKSRIVSGKLAIRPDLVWQGWRKFFTLEGQIYALVAREFVVSNLMRFNRKLTPQIGVPGALYCTWSDLLLMAPYYMGFMQTLTYRDWAKWWLGFGPPKFSEAKDVKHMPEALTGASDDTCMAFLASMASWKDGKLSLDAPPTPLHSLVRLFKSFWIERSHSYEPEARIYTYTPSTIKGLWVQRVRWNSSRFECTGRFWRGFWYHWEIGFPTSLHLSLVMNHVVRVIVYYGIIPFYLVTHGQSSGLAFLYGYLFHIVEDILYTAIAFTMERDIRRCWRSALALPLSPLYTIVFANLACAYGVTKDLLFFGNPTKFAPEWTLIAGRTSRVALMYRVTRFVKLCLRSALYGDVPFGSFWFGWLDTPWTPNGFEGWTTGKAPTAVVPWLGLRKVFGLAPKAAFAKVAPTPVGRQVLASASLATLCLAVEPDPFKTSAALVEPDPFKTTLEVPTTTATVAPPSRPSLVGLPGGATSVVESVRRRAA